MLRDAQKPIDLLLWEHIYMRSLIVKWMIESWHLFGRRTVAAASNRYHRRPGAISLPEQSEQSDINYSKTSDLICSCNIRLIYANSMLLWPECYYRRRYDAIVVLMELGN